MAESKKPGTSKSKTRILLVDDHAIVRFGIGQVINRESDLMVCGEEENASRALQAITTLKPDLVIADISLNQKTISNTPPEATYDWIKKQTPDTALFATEIDGELFLLTGRQSHYFATNLRAPEFRQWLKERRIDYVLYFNLNLDLILKSRDGHYDTEPLRRDYFNQELGLRLVYDNPAEKTFIFKTTP